MTDPMTDPCEVLHAYVDGELGDDEAAAFESHLVSCDACIAELPRLLALLAALDDAVALDAQARPGTARLTLIAGGPARAAAEAAAVPEVAAAPAAAHAFAPDAAAPDALTPDAAASTALASTAAAAAAPTALTPDAAASAAAAAAAAAPTAAAAAASAASTARTPAPAAAAAAAALTPASAPAAATAPAALALAPAAVALAAAAPAAAAPMTPLVRRRRTTRIAWLAAGPLAAAAVLALVLWPQARAPRLALGPTRPIVPWLSSPGTGDHRPFDAPRGGGGQAATDELERTERAFAEAKDWHGAAVAALLAGDRERAARDLARAPATPEVEADRAVLELLDGRRPALERALDHVDRALAAAPGSAAAHWNRALILAALNLPLAAAQELDRVRALGERGWSDEARTRADALRAQVTQRKAHWKQAHDAGDAMVEAGTPVPAELADVTGVLTLDLYDAVRAAPSADHALALVPLARTLDAAYRGTHLADYVQRVAASDFRIRGPLAERYREVARRRAAPEATTALLAQLAAAGLDDIRMGAMVFAGRVAAQLDDYRKLAAATGDPWFALIAENEAARGEIARGQHAAAERRLREAIALARRERMAYRAVRLETDLVALYNLDSQLRQAAEVAADAYQEAIAAREWVLEMGALNDLAATHHNRYAYGLARAYLTELAERAEAGLATGADAYASIDCARRVYIHESLANLSMLQFDPERARAELARAPKCQLDPSNPDHAGLLLRSALIRSELYGAGHRAEDARLARDSLAQLRDLPDTVVAGKDAFLAYVEGGLGIQDDPAAGRRALRDAIARAGRDRHEYSVKARAYSFSLLALEAGSRAAFDEVTGVMAEALGVTRPARCGLAIAADGARHAVAITDARGETAGQYIARTPGAPDPATLVPANLVDRLRGCAEIAVLARAPVLGAGRLLPPELAWSYLLTDPVAPGAARSDRRLVIANPEAPPELNLPALGAYPEEPAGSGVTVLRGRDATPSRALAAMQDASVIEFHTHGLLADDLFEASHLVLSPELDRSYALTADDIARVRLTAAPLVALGACHAAASSRSLEGGMGLAEAFLRAGARAVIASPDEVPDLGAQAFFAAVRDRVLAGAAPAVALRDERMHHLAASRDDTWVSGVVVFQ